MKKTSLIVIALAFFISLIPYPTQAQSNLFPSCTDVPDYTTALFADSRYSADNTAYFIVKRDWTGSPLYGAPGLLVDWDTSDATPLNLQDSDATHVGAAGDNGSGGSVYSVNSDGSLTAREYYGSTDINCVSDLHTGGIDFNNSTWTFDGETPPPLEMDMRSDFSITGQYDNFTATYLGTSMCEFGINNNCNPSDMPSPLVLRWRLINDDLTVDPFSYGDMTDANTVCTVVTAYNDPFTSDSCIELFPENSSKWVKNGHYTLYLQPFIQQSVLDSLPQYNITMRYTGQAFNTGLANYTYDTSNNTISEDGTFTTPPSVAPYLDCGSLYPITWSSFDNFLPAIGCQINNGLTMLFVPSSDSLNAIFTSTTFETHGLTAIITTPLSLINDLTTSGCSPISLPLPYVSQNLTLPCMGAIYSENFGDIFIVYQTITTGFISYWIIVKFLHKVKGFKDPEEDKIEVLDL